LRFSFSRWITPAASDGERGAAGQLEQRRRHLCRSVFDLLVELADRAIQG